MDFRSFQKKVRGEIEKSQNSALHDEFWLWIFEVTGKTRAFFLSNINEPFSEQNRSRVYEIMKRRLIGEPFAYIIGKTSFYGRDFVIDDRVLVPRPDSEILIEVLLEYVQKNWIDRSRAGEKYFFYDLCTGSGCLGITAFLELKKMDISAEGVLTDLSPEAIAVARKNTELLHGGSELLCVETDLVSGQGRLADFIISNPPYIRGEDIQSLMKEVSRFEPEIALDGGGDGLLFYRRLAEEAMPLLQKEGILLVEHGYDQASQVEEIFSDAGYTQTRSYMDYGGNDRVVFVRK